MKKLFAVSFFCLIAAVVAADSANTIEMVTYFPVPYTSYQQLDVVGRCDVGLVRECRLNVDGDIAIDKELSKLVSGELWQPFQRDMMFPSMSNGNLTVSSGELSLAVDADSVSPSALYATKVRVGEGTGTDPTFRFSHNLELGGLSGDKAGLKVENTATIKTLKLGDFPFPGCTTGTRKVQWKRLTIDGANKIFLVCGE